MRRLILTAAVLLLATPAFAAPIVLTIQNKSSQAVTRLNTFGVDKAGQPVEDNLGGLMEDIPAGATGTLELGMSRCQPIYLALGLGGSDDDLTATLDTCNSTTLVVSD